MNQFNFVKKYKKHDLSAFYAETVVYIVSNGDTGVGASSDFDWSYLQTKNKEKNVADWINYC